jgi:phospholipid/cholesterol/gamma-HCH transport system permease protein
VTISRPHSQFPWLKGAYRSLSAPWLRIGSQTKFYVRTLRSIHYAFTGYRVELIRLIAQMGLGAGALIIIGGTVAIVGFLTVTTGALVAVQGYTDFSEIGVEALTGFASAFFNVRLIAPGYR